jgi:hypothetical protein
VMQGAREQGRGAGRISHRTAAWIAWSIWLISIPLTTFSGLLNFLSASDSNQPDAALTVIFALLLLTFPTVGALVAARRPENPIGWIFCAVGLVFGLGVAAEGYASYALHVRSGPLPGVQYAAWFSSWASLPMWFLAATMLFLLFPDGRLPSPLVLWRPLAWTAVIGSVMVAFGDALGSGTDYPSIANPVAVGGTLGNFLEMVGGFGYAFLALSCFASMASPLVRLRRARGQERQQLKWFVFATALAATGFVLASAWPSARPGSVAWILGEVVWNMGILGFLVLPIATAIAILRYRLYDIDRIINRTLVYGALTAMLALVYLVGVTATQTIFRAITDQDDPPQLAIVISTLVIAALFNPLRRRIQGFIDRRFYRRKYDAAKTLEAFSAKLRDETDLDTLREDLVTVVRETMQPAHVILWLRPHTASKKDQAPG